MNENEVEYEGSSMRFFLKRGDRVRYARAVPAELALGDIVVFLMSSPQGDPLSVAAHRLVWKVSRGGLWRLWAKGDSNPSLDPEAPASALIGKVVAVKRGARPWRSTVDARGRLQHLSYGAASNAFFGFLFLIRGSIVELLTRLSRRPTPGLRAVRRALTEAMVLSESLYRGAASS